MTTSKASPRDAENQQTTASLSELQSDVHSWIEDYGVRYFSELTNLAQLVEEVGEVARLMSRKFGEQSFKPGEDAETLGDELADVMFVLVCIANQTGVNLTDAWKRNIDKKTKRDSTRHIENKKLSQ